MAEGPRVEALRKFLGATYEGWGQAIQSPTDAARDLWPLISLSSLHAPRGSITALHLHLVFSPPPHISSNPFGGGGCTRAFLPNVRVPSSLRPSKVLAPSVPCLPGIPPTTFPRGSIPGSPWVPGRGESSDAVPTPVRGPLPGGRATVDTLVIPPCPTPTQPGSSATLLKMRPFFLFSWCPRMTFQKRSFSV